MTLIYRLRMGNSVNGQTGEIDYDFLIMLDGEDLAEQGVLNAYEEIVPHLLSLGVTPRSVTESIDATRGAYSVTFDGEVFDISGSEVENRNSWGLATFALFEIVNRQLSSIETKMSAMSGGNDLGGIFMTPAQADLARAAMPGNRRGWPYIPTAEPDWFGMFHG